MLHCGLNSLEDEKLIEYIGFLWSISYKTFSNLSNEPYMHEHGKPSKDMRWCETLSFSYEHVVEVVSQLQLIVWFQTSYLLQDLNWLQKIW